MGILKACVLFLRGMLVPRSTLAIENCAGPATFARGDSRYRLPQGMQSRSDLVVIDMMLSPMAAHKVVESCHYSASAQHVSNDRTHLTIEQPVTRPAAVRRWAGAGGGQVDQSLRGIGLRVGRQQACEAGHTVTGVAIPSLAQGVVVDAPVLTGSRLRRVSRPQVSREDDVGYTRE